jgi:hypothetical protein
MRMRVARGLVLAAVVTVAAGSAEAKPGVCRIDYRIDGWSIFFQSYDGSGTVTCDDGQRRAVAIRLRGGGVTLGKMEINKGKGKFSEVESIEEIFGTYVAVDGQAGATLAAEGRVMTRGKVGLVISGTGRGWALGVSFGGFTIESR